MFHHQLFRVLAFLFCLIGCALCVLGMIAQQPPGDAVRYPISGSGGGGAYGPSILHSFSDLPSPSAEDKAMAAQRALLIESLAEKQAGVLSRANQAVIPPWSRQVQSNDSEFIESGDSATPSNAAAPTVSNGFSETTTLDVAGTTNGSAILVYNGASVLAVHSMTGTLLKQTPDSAFWCSGTNPLQVCGTGGFAADPRVKYDTRSKHWIVTALWLLGSNSVAQDVLAVSQTSDPTQGWNLYQFPACGAFDNWDGSDQPHTGFNDKWIVVTSACSSSSSGVNGAGLAVFDKSNLYAGGALTLNQNWFEFVDPFSGGPYSGIGGGDGTRDHPVTTYNSNGREYLVTSTNNTPSNTGNAGVIYSYVAGPTDAPTFHPARLTVNTSFSAIGMLGVAVDAPGCTNCIAALSNSWIHSAGLWNWKDGFPRVVSTMVMGQPGLSGATQVINVVMKIANGTSTALRISKNAAGSGPLASEIGVPLGGTSTINEALIAYDYSDSAFYPGIKMAIWNVDNNSIISRSVLKAGILTPNNGDQNRWTDFMDALSPIPGKGSFVVGGTVARPTPNDDQQRATFWGTVTP